jgi:hypothetical protein
MKIIINELETYEIKIPNEVNAKDFMKLLTSFDNVVKLIKFNIIREEFRKNPDYKNEVIKTKRTYTKLNTRLWCDTREKTLDLMQYAYHGTKEDRIRIEEITGVTWNGIVKGFNGFKRRYNIQPQEIGLNFWRGIGEHHANLIGWKIPNWTIKSYTGYFDENGRKI